MSDLKLQEFRERAERGLVTPDLADLERRGRALRRRRSAAAAGAFALVLMAGGAIAGLAADGETDAIPATPTSPSPSPSGAYDTHWDDGVRVTRDREGEEDVLLPGRSEAVYDGVRVRFAAPGKQWEWWDVGMGLRRRADLHDDYGAAVFFLRDVVARLEPCNAGRSQALGADPDALVANVAPLLDVARTSVLQGPRVVRAFGVTAVHVRLQTHGACPEGGPEPTRLRGMHHGAGLEPGFGGQHVLDLWHVVVPSTEPESMLVVSWDLDGTEKHRDQAMALLDSLRIDAAG